MVQSTMPCWIDALLSGPGCDRNRAPSTTRRALRCQVAGEPSWPWRSTDSRPQPRVETYVERDVRRIPQPLRVQALRASLRGASRPTAQPESCSGPTRRAGTREKMVGRTSVSRALGRDWRWVASVRGRFNLRRRAPDTTWCTLFARARRHADVRAVKRKSCGGRRAILRAGRA